jgi:hypothetical protein
MWNFFYVPSFDWIDMSSKSIIDYAKVETKEPFKWGEAIIGVLILPAVCCIPLLIQIMGGPK